jgi:hypothetical protein
MSSRFLKEEILQLLAEDDMDLVNSRLQSYPVKDVIHALFSAICRADEKIRWHGVVAMGSSVARLADQDMEEARIIMRRLMWSLNEESGGIGWGAPEAMAEIMSCHQGLAEEYIHMLISYMRDDGKELFQDGNFLEHEALQRGVLWGIGRLAEERPRMLRERGADEDLPAYLSSPDPAVRGLAARALGILRVQKAAPGIEQLREDSAPVRVYEDGGIRTATVGELAGQALDRIGRHKSV